MKDWQSTGNFFSFRAAALAGVLVTVTAGIARDKALVNTSKSPHAKLSPLNLTDVQWTDGFWADRYTVCKEAMVPHTWTWPGP